MSLIARSALLVIACAVVAGCGGGDDSSAEPSAAPAVPPVTVALREENGSGQTGTATLRVVDDMSTSVVIALRGAKHSYEPAHVHKGSCADYRKLTSYDAQAATVVDELQDVEAGKSESTVYAPLADRTTGGYSINVHEPTGKNVVVACGDIPKR